MVRIAVATLGCKVNQYESAGMVETLRENGFSPVSFDGNADVYIINTCTVTGKSDYQSRQLIRRAARANPEANILVTGCYAQIAPEEIARLPGVTMVAGNMEKGDILRLIRETVGGERKTVFSDIRRVKEFSAPATDVFPGRTRAFLKIQDGCDAFCSYCIVPYARGKSRSLPEAEALERVDSLSKAGYQELVLTGINLGAYGDDLSPATDLLRLLRRIEQKSLIPRLRLSSLEPLEITGDMLSFIRDAGRFCRHFHVPLQSGDDRILSLMGRKYDAVFFKSLVEKILYYLPDAAVGIDVMVGFPGEDEEAFSHSRQLIESLPVAYLHVFPYSPRPGTPASSLPGRVTESDKKKRVSIITHVGRTKRETFAGRFLGKELSVLLEARRDQDTRWMKGYSHNYIPVIVTNGNISLVNSLVKVIVNKIKDGKLIGRIVECND
ncbi:MAG TPA: tRNA (N(6)-L-threonylcarbamoyladenosine(37)-C(2))-methylthiotransferase MtaB [Syntrophales bacterium]|nr:tRNA (N(6)-L-threonylcarbamoyladenosine(37)-C(2))-methylthiotransferase MtaB [Syntrophales bacterium]